MFRAAGELAISGHGIELSCRSGASAALLTDEMRLYLIDFGRDRRNRFVGPPLVPPSREGQDTSFETRIIATL